MHPKIEAVIDRYGVTDAARAFLGEEHKLYIDGAFVEAASKDRVPVIEPSTGETLTTIAAAGKDDVDCAVAAANRALAGGDWAGMKSRDRQRILLRLADLIEANAQTLGEIESLDNGKALGPCVEMDILGGAELLRYMAGFATKIEGATREVSAPGSHFAATRKEPIGVVAAIVPWNWPFNMAMWKIAAPLAAGCAIVLKPAEQTSLSMLYFMKLCERAGLPKGVLNLVTGSGRAIGDHLVGHPGVSKVSFTGSTEVGRRVGETAGRALTPVTLELGGKSPMLVFADADLDAVAASTRWSVFFNAGQVCSAGSRIYAHRSVFEKAVTKIKQVAEGMVMAPGLDPACDIGPVVSASAKANIETYIRKGVAEGARIVCGGDETPGDGFFVKPTILTADDNTLSVVQEEIFGPVVVILPFDEEAEAVALANDNQYGLAASIWTRDISRALRLVPRIKAGTVWVNAHDLIDSAMPFGGFKNSGFGKDMGPEQLDHFLRTKSVWISVAEGDE
ncbi:MAG: aldehyde dehydrogenase family protein [Betaproteobacteria bacterium]|nr:aldehyde dehydrogenase family protein [Betaproteobacteria bacterium]